MLCKLKIKEIDAAMCTVGTMEERFMACFLVSAAEAAVITVTAKIIEKKEKKEIARTGVVEAHKIPFSRKLRWLSNLQWGGSALLAFEHLWHGEIVPWAPFLTAMSDKAATGEMLHEMATVGVCMAALTTAVWLGMLAVSAILEKRARAEALASESGV